MTYFLHLAEQGDFEQGIFLPYNTREEAERQAAWDIYNGADPEMFLQIFEADRHEPKFGWTRKSIDDARDQWGAESPHLVEKYRARVATTKQILASSRKHAETIMREHEEAVVAEVFAQHEIIKAGITTDPRHDPKAGVPGNAYSWNTGGTATAAPAALSAATAKTIVLILSAGSNQPCIVELGVSFDGVSASATPVLVELVSGTAGTAGTPRATLASGKQERGWPAQTSQTTCGDTYSAEPTTQLVSRKWYVPPAGGPWAIQMPLGREPTALITAATDAKTWSLRATAPATVNVVAYLHFEE